MTIIQVTKEECIKNNSVLYFWASWHEASASPKSPMNSVFQALAESTSSSAGVSFFRVEAEDMSSLSQKYDVQVIPTFILLGHDGKVLDRIDGGDDIPGLTKAVATLASSTTSGSNNKNQSAPKSKKKESIDENMKLESRLKSLIESSQVMLFMKGDPTAPKCGFSRQIVELLKEEGISFRTFDILSNEEVRQGLKTYSDWPTYPQLYVNGDLLGGLDIVREMAEEGDLAGQIGVEKNLLGDRLKKLTTRHRIMLFMKGLPSAPKCGFSRQIVELLGNHNANYDSFNILEDEEVRQGLKTFSDWPTYPQLYVDGDFVGGLDIVKEMDEGGDLAELLQEP